MMRRAVILFSFVVLAGSARALLPADASTREPQIRAYRQQVRDHYEERLVERQAEAVRAYERTRADIFTPPWLRGEQDGGLQTEADAAAAAADRMHERFRHVLISIIFLSLIVGGAGWVWYKTREIDG